MTGLKVNFNNNISSPSSYQVAPENVKISGPQILIDGETKSLICESSPSYPGEGWIQGSGTKKINK